MLQTFAAGMVPDTSLLLINEDERGASMDVKNSDDNAQLLYTRIVDLPDDPTRVGSSGKSTMRV